METDGTDRKSYIISLLWDLADEETLDNQVVPHIVDNWSVDYLNSIARAEWFRDDIWEPSRDRRFNEIYDTIWERYPEERCSLQKLRFSGKHLVGIIRRDDAQDRSDYTVDLQVVKASLDSLAKRIRTMNTDEFESNKDNRLGQNARSVIDCIHSLLEDSDDMGIHFWSASCSVLGGWNRFIAAAEVVAEKYQGSASSYTSRNERNIDPTDEPSITFFLHLVYRCLNEGLFKIIAPLASLVDAYVIEEQRDLYPEATGQYKRLIGYIAPELITPSEIGTLLEGRPAIISAAQMAVTSGVIDAEPWMDKRITPSRFLPPG
jgi:hypothetical protein